MKKRDIVYLALFIAFSGLIIGEACVPSSGSSLQSKFLAWIFDNGSKEATIISPNGLTIQGEDKIYIGQKNIYKPVFNPENTSDKRVNYYIEDTDECVEDLGNMNFLGLKDGSFTLFMTSVADSSLKSQMSISVMKEPITSLTISTSSANLIKGMSGILNVESNVLKLLDSDYYYVSDNTDIVSFDEDGYFFGKNIGSTDIYVKSYTGIESNHIEISVTSGVFNPVSEINYTGDNSIYAGQKKTLSLAFNSNASDLKYLAESDNESVRIDDGNLIGLEPGKSNITFTSVSNKSVKTTASIEVKEVKAKSINVSEASIQYGKTQRVNFSLVPEIEGLPVTYKDVDFSSSDPSIASIDDLGRIVGYKKGNVRIKVEWKEDPSISEEAIISITSMDGEKFDNINYWTRKIIGHFSVFMVTGVFGLLLAYDLFFKNQKLRILFNGLINVLYGFSLAGISELLQMTAKGRGPSFKDVGIDTSGYALGVLIVGIILLIIQLKRSHKNKSQK